MDGPVSGRVLAAVDPRCRPPVGFVSVLASNIEPRVRRESCWG